MGYELKIWGDERWFPAETKGSSQFIRPKHIIVTSNYHPKDIWQDDTTLGPILRRYKILHFLSLDERVFGAADEEVETAYNPAVPTTPDFNLDTLTPLNL